MHLNEWPLQRLAPCRQEARSQLTCKAFTEHIAGGRRKSCREDQGASPVQVHSLHAHMHDFIKQNDNNFYLCVCYRDSGVILLASGGAGMELLQIWGHWFQGLDHRSSAHANSIQCTKQYSVPSCTKQPANLNHWSQQLKYLLLLVLRQSRTGLHREEPTCSLTGICYSRRVGTDLIHEAPFPRQGPCE